MSRHPFLYTLLLTLFLLLPIVPVYPEMCINNVVITGNVAPDLAQKIRHYIPFIPNTPVTEEQVQETINGIKALNLFKNIQYTLTPTSSGGYQLDLNLNSAPKIRGLNVKGNYPLLGRNITKLITLQPGSVFDETQIPASVETIENYLTRQGYYGSNVIIDSKPTKKHNNVDLQIRIQKGRRYRIGTVTVQGNQVFTSERIKNKIQHWTHFKPTQFQKDLKKIQKMYANKGFIKTRVEPDALVFHDDTNKVDITVILEENKHLSVGVGGTPFFFRSHILDVINLKERRSYDRYAINQSKERLRRYYETRGFPNALIETEINKPTETEVTARYTIMPGLRVELREIQFDGNDQIGGKKLKKNLDSHESGVLSRGFFDEVLLNNDREKVLRTYLDRGFFDAEIGMPRFESNKFGDHRVAIYPVTEGKRYRIADIQIRTQDAVDAPMLIKKSNLAIDKHFSAEKLNKAKTRILEYLQEQGFAYATVSPELDKDPTQGTVKIIFDVTIGTSVRIRSITLDGSFITRQNTILNTIKFKTGDLFVYQDLLDSQLMLRKLGIFTSVQITPLGFEAKSDQVDVLIGVIERKTWEADVRGGFDSRYLATGELSLTKHNVFGTGRQINTRLIGGPEYDRGELTFYSPRIFGANWNLANQYFGEYENQPYYTDTSFGASVSTLKTFGSHFAFGFREQVTRTDLFESESDLEALGDSVYDNTLNEFQLNASYDSRNNYADPTSGFYVLARNEINTSLTDLSDNFNISEVDVSHFQGFLKRFTLVNTARFGSIDTVSGNPIIPANKLFFLGGSDTLRGFDEDAVNPSGGTTMFLTNNELQFRITNSIKFAGFFDAGALTSGFENVSWNDVRESAGVGLRYVTPLGPLRLDWAFILDRQENEPSNHFHFSFGYFF